MKRNVAFDGLRGLAAVSVVLLHLRANGLYPIAGENHAVDLFFILSGFVVAGAYDRRIQQDGTLAFMRLRLERLYPLYALSLLSVPAFSLFIGAISKSHNIDVNTWISFLFQAFYLPTPPQLVPSHMPAFLLNGPAWSLFWELWVNLFYALLLPRLTNRVLAVISIMAAVAAACFALNGAVLQEGSDWPTWHLGAIRVLFGFPMGVLLYRLPRPKFSLPFWLIASIAGASLFVPGIVAMCLVMPLVVWLASTCRTQSKILGGIGWISYPLYAIHLPLFPWVTWLTGRQMHLSSFAQGVACLLAALVAAWILALGDERLQLKFKALRKADKTKRDAGRALTDPRST